MPTEIGMRKAGPTEIGPAGKTGPTEFGPAGGHGNRYSRSKENPPVFTIIDKVRVAFTFYFYFLLLVF